MYSLFDSHVHLDARALAGDRLAEELRGARLAGLQGAVIAGYGPDEIARSAEICDHHRGIWRAIGVHPWWLADHADDAEGLEAAWQAMVHSARDRPPVALGEFGLDRGVRDRLPMQVQEHWLRRGLDLAAEMQLPVILHVVGAPARASEILAPYNRARLGILHRYGGSAEMVPDFEAMGLYLSLSSAHLRRNPDKAAAVAKAISADRLLVETDWAGGGTGYANELRAMRSLIAALARWRREDEGRLAARLVANAMTIYGVDPRGREGQP